MQRRTITKSKKAFSSVAALIRIHLISHLGIKWGVVEGRRVYTQRKKRRNKSPTAIQTSLFK